MEYTFRQLTSKDIFPMSKIISKIGIKEFKETFESDAVKALVKKGGKGNADAIGVSIMIDIASIILSNLPKCESDIFAFLSSVTGLKVEEIENASMADFAEMVITLVQKEEFKDFFGVVSRLFN